MELLYEINNTYNYYNGHVDNEKLNEILSEDIEKYLNWSLSDNGKEIIKENYGNISNLSKIIAQHYTSKNGNFNVINESLSGAEDGLLLEFLGGLLGKAGKWIGKTLFKKGAKTVEKQALKQTEKQIGKELLTKGGKKLFDSCIKNEIKNPKLYNSLVRRANMIASSSLKKSEKKAWMEMSRNIPKNAKEYGKVEQVLNKFIKKGKKPTQKEFIKEYERAGGKFAKPPKPKGKMGGTGKTTKPKTTPTTSQKEAPKLPKGKSGLFHKVLHGAATVKGYVVKAGTKLFNTIMGSKIAKYAIGAVIIWGGYKWLVKNGYVENIGKAVDELLNGGGNGEGDSGSNIGEGLYPTTYGGPYRNVNKKDYLMY